MRYIKNKNIKNILLGSIPFVFLIVLWQLIYVFQWVPHWMLPSPLLVLKEFYKLLIDGTLFRLLFISMKNAIPAFILALITSILLGILIGVNKTFRKIISPFLGAIYLVPSLAWIPFIILFFGFTRETIWIVIFISAFMKMIYSTISGVRNVNPNWILAAKNIGLSKFKIILKVILPGALPEIMTGIRLGFGSAWRSLVGAEMLISIFGGLGKFIWTAQWTFSFDKVLIGIFLIAIIGLIMEELVFKKIEKATLVKWGNIS
ncbi:ABC transporter permease [archaeon]|nr:ABC transporter permease [archaeon]NCP79248.1 ABC transporter permease [archaeon]NCP97805.1 ABC transporter permease [archaeon]NCQ07015.1 ABC transporter permease [archaeon]NCQ50811.1 ABC transporter permease [archaeon]